MKPSDPTEPEELEPISGFDVARILALLVLIGFGGLMLISPFKVLSGSLRLLGLFAVPVDYVRGLGASLGMWLGGIIVPPLLQTFITLTLSLVVEGLPFVILGVLFATIIRVAVPAAVLLRFLPRRRYPRRIAIALLGVFMPVCECGNVPVARSLMSQGMSAQDVTAFLLAAPIINPITFLATWEAFGLSHMMAVTRLVAALAIALIVGALLDRAKRPEELLTRTFAAACHPHEQPRRDWGQFFEIYQTEFWLIMKMLCIGALIAAATQTVVPRELITALGSNVWLSLLSMLALALVVSICSGVDAFFALSYAGSFPLGSLLTFLIAGPMINLKSLSIMKSTFSTRYLMVVVPSVAVLALAVGLVVNLAGVR